MVKWLLIVETDCSDPAREVEFNEWYNKIHLSDVLETPGYVSATRYENTEPSEGKAKFLAAYMVETDDINKVRKASSENIARKRAQGRWSELLEVKSRGVYRQIYSLSK